MNGFWEDKQVLVTGAGGCIGSHLVESLLACGAQVRAFVRYNSRRRDVGLCPSFQSVSEVHLRSWQVICVTLRPSRKPSKAVRLSFTSAL